MLSDRNINRARGLHAVKLLHTAVWAIFAACIVVLPMVAAAGLFTVAVILIVFVSIEVLVLVVNGFRCPLTAVAARYTDDRSDNFDIYLPLWIARHNKTIFGSLFFAGVLYTFVAWRNA